MFSKGKTVGFLVRKIGLTLICAFGVQGLAAAQNPLANQWVYTPVSSVTNLSITSNGKFIAVCAPGNIQL